MEERKRHWRVLLSDHHAFIWDRIEAAVLLGLPLTGWKMVHEFIRRDTFALEYRVTFALAFGYVVKRKRGRVILFHSKPKDRYEIKV